MKCFSSLDALAVVLKLYDEGLDVLARGLPVADATLRIAVEVLFLLVEQRLRLDRVLVVLAELVLGRHTLIGRLLLQELDQLEVALALFLALLLLSQLQLLVAHLPELGEVLFLLQFVVFLLLLALDLKGA